MRLSVSALLSWMRGGYPERGPGEDYIALIGLLPRRLTEDEVVAIANQLREGADTDDIRKRHIKAAIRAHVLGHQVHKKDVKAVRQALVTDDEQPRQDCGLLSSHTGEQAHGRGPGKKRPGPSTSTTCCV